jgi:hypothetical protein
MTRQAFAEHPLYLILAIVVFPITFIITSFRLAAAECVCSRCTCRWDART